MAMNDELLAHHIATIKLGNDLGNQAGQYVAEMRRIVRERVAGFDAETRTNKRLEALILKLAKELSVPAGEYRKLLEKELKSFARYEAIYQAETISEWLNFDFTTPTLEAV